MQLFYAPNIHTDKYTFDEAESKHAVKVLRMKTGDTVHITDGKGNFYETEIIDPHPSKCIVKIRNIITGFEDKGYFLHIAIAPTKNIKRFEWFLEKCTEIGIDEITPLICEHSERRQLKTERANRIITSALKQSLKTYHPVFNEM